MVVVVGGGNIVSNVHSICIVKLVVKFTRVLVGLGTVGGSDPHGEVFIVVVGIGAGVGERLERLNVGIEGKGILHGPHAILGGGSKWLAVLAVAFHFLNTSTDFFRRVCAFKMRSFEFGNRPGAGMKEYEYEYGR